MCWWRKHMYHGSLNAWNSEVPGQTYQSSIWKVLNHVDRGRRYLQRTLKAWIWTLKHMSHIFFLWCALLSSLLDERWPPFKIFLGKTECLFLIHPKHYLPFSMTVHCDSAAASLLACEYTDVRKKVLIILSHHGTCHSGQHRVHPDMVQVVRNWKRRETSLGT